MAFAAAIVAAAAVAVEVDHRCGGPLDTGAVAAAVGDTDAPGEDPFDEAALVVAAAVAGENRSTLRQAAVAVAVGQSCSPR